jgi:coproporphyrinogen III oxidase
MIPTFRSDVRIFYVEGVGAFLGGGADLTPYYLFDDDITEFHNVYKSLSDEKHSKLTECSYAALKQQCDEYFYLPARSEHRGVGGIFFDHVPATATSMAFLKDVTCAWMPSWFPICQRRRDLVYSDDQKHWQLLRRGRYLEFNLLYDRGVQFGLAKANPRVEAVMVSAPPRIAWDYNPTIVPGSEEARLVEVLKAPRDWAK